MKQLLFTLILFLSGINILQAQESNPYEETTWNVIRERLFSGENSKAYRFEEDIRFQLTGEATKEDSAVLQNIIGELKNLIEIVDVKLVNEDGNFVFTIYPPENEISSRTFFHVKKNSVSGVEVELNSNVISDSNEKRKFFAYHSFFYLTKTFEPKFGRTGYFGIFDSPSFNQSGSTKKIDKNLIRKLYSKDFYKQLKRNTVKNWGILYYLNLRFETWIKLFSKLIAVVITIIGFLYFLSKEKSVENTLSFLKYLKNGVIILFIISIVYAFLELQKTIPNLPKTAIFFLFLNDIKEVFSYGIPAIILVYLSERYFLNKIPNFLKRQLSIYIVSTLLIFICMFIVSQIDSYFIRLKYGTVYSSVEMYLMGLFNISVFTSLRLLYNFINYRIQSMVNQKDVELAKMKELKNQAELNALHSRINPHFLYNSLNSIAELAHINPDKTENMAVALSELFRYSINKENKTFVKVEEELEMVKKYLEIEKTRFAEKLNYTITVDEAAKEKLIPKFLIQPLAENAIKHGLSKITETGKISIEVKQLENDLVIAIFDNGPDFPDEPVSGYGLQNLNDKLEILYGKQATIYWENGDNKHFRITIKNQFKG